MQANTRLHGWLRALTLVFAAALLAGCAQAPEKPAKLGVVIQVSDNDAAKWNLALNNAKNFQQAVGVDKTDIEIVAFGPGLNMMKLDSEVGGRLEDAKKAGVKVYACGNTMRNMKLTKDDLHPSAEVVPSGVVEIGTKQQAGFSYLRP